MLSEPSQNMAINKEKAMNTNVTTNQAAVGQVNTSITHPHGVIITWEMLNEAMAGVLKPHHVEEVCYYLFSAEEGYSFCWDNIQGVKGIGPKTLEKIKGAYQNLMEMEPEEQGRLASVEEYEAELALEERLRDWADKFEAQFLKKQEEQAEAEARSLSSETISGGPDSNGETTTTTTTTNEETMDNMSNNMTAAQLIAALRSMMSDEALEELFEQVRATTEAPTPKQVKKTKKKLKKSANEVTAEVTAVNMAVDMAIEEEEAQVLETMMPSPVQEAAMTVETVNTADGQKSKKQAKRDKTIADHNARENHRQANYGRQESFVIHGDENEGRVSMAIATQLRGLLAHMVERGYIKKENEEDVLQPALIHILNERRHKEDDRKIEPADDQAFLWGNITPVIDTIGFLVVKGSHLVNRNILRVLAHTFPKAADFRAYVSGLCAPGTFVHNVECYFDKECLVPQLEINKDFHLVPTGKMVDGKPDGNGWIHADHWMIRHLNLTEDGGSIQVRFWDPETGMFCKGILVVVDCDLAVRDGKPAIVMNSSFVKGRLKGTDLPEKVVLSGTAINVWNREHSRDLSRWCFELLQQLVVNDETKKGVSGAIKRWLDNFRRQGGMDRYVNKACNEDRIVAFQVQLARSMGWNPLSIKDVANVAFIHAMKDFYTLMQGAGIKSPTYTMVINDGMPAFHMVNGELMPVIAVESETHIEKVLVTVKPNAKGGTPSWVEFVSNTRGVEEPLAGSANLNGRVTTRSVDQWKATLKKLNEDMNIRKDKNGVPILTPGTELWVEQIDDVNLPGDIVLDTRYPLVSQQNFVFCVVVKPHTGVLKATGRLSSRTMQAALHIIELFNMGDADGDRKIIEGREWILDWVRPEFKIRNVHGGNEVAYMLEPSKADAAKDPTAKIRVFNPAGNLNPDAIKLIARDGGGPVGVATYLNAMFLQLATGCENKKQEDFFLRCALAMAIVVQEAIDRMKRTTPYTNPDFAFKKDSWIEVQENVYALPKDDPNRFCGDWWYNGGSRVNDIDVQKLIEWALRKVEDIYPHLKEKRNRDGSRKWGMKKIMGWRKVATGDKKLDPREWAHVGPLVGSGNLVNYCAGEAYRQWSEGFGLEIQQLPVARVVEMLKEALKKALAAKGETLNLNWEPVPEKTAKFLRQQVGLTDYNNAMHKVRSLDFEARASAREAAQAAMSSAASECTLQDVATVITMELESLVDEGDRDRRMNNIMRLAAIPNGPIVKALGFDEGGRCSYMAEVMARFTDKKGREHTVTRAEQLVPHLQKIVDSRREAGEVTNLYTVALEMTGRVPMEPEYEDAWAKKDIFFDTTRDFSKVRPNTTEADWTSRHKRAKGVAIHRCRHCCDLIDYHVRQHLTDDKKMENRSMVTRRITTINGFNAMVTHADTIVPVETCKALEVWLKKDQIEALFPVLRIMLRRGLIEKNFVL